MPKLPDSQIWAAQGFTENVVRLRQAKGQFLLALAQAFAGNLAENPVSFSLNADALDGGELLFNTPYGDVKGIPDLVIRDSQPFGRITFWTVVEDARGEIQAKQVWSILFNQQNRATLSEGGNFEWFFGPTSVPHHDGMAEFVMSLAAHVIAALPTIASPQ